MRGSSFARYVPFAGAAVAAITLTVLPLALIASTDCKDWSGMNKQCGMDIRCDAILDTTAWYCKQICTGYGYPDPGCCYYKVESFHWANTSYGDCPCATPNNHFDVITVPPPGGTDPNKTCYNEVGGTAACQTAADGGCCR